MAYVSRLEDLADARAHIMADIGCSQDEAETEICRAIADGAINFQGELKLHATKRFTARGTVLDGEAFQLPKVIGRGDLDWENSSPRQPWYVKRGHYELPGLWQLERIRLSKADVRRVLCTDATIGESDTANKIRPATGRTDGHIAPNTNSTRTMSERRRGRRPTKLTATMEAMRQEILSGSITPIQLGSMLEKNLSQRYGVSRDTARKARNGVLSEFA